MIRPFVVLAVALGLAAAGCSSNSGADSSVSSTTTAAEPTTTTAAETTTTSDPGFVEATDLVYMTIDGIELLMDVYTPAGEGPWPVVVAFHGLD